MGNVINISNAFSRNSLNGFISDSNKTLSPYKEKYLCSKTPKNNAEIYNCLYDYLNDSYRIEYFYKNTIFNKIILGKYSLNTASAITELPLSNSIADLVVFGKEAVVYEIKTDYDNLSKLKHQILDYYKVFAKVYVVTGRQFVEKAKKFIENSNLPVGLKVVNNNTSISTVIKADNCFSFLDKRSIFGVLRKSEYESILVKYYNKLPRTNDFNHYNTCYN